MEPIGTYRPPLGTVSKLSACALVVAISMVFTEEDLLAACALFVTVWLVVQLWNLEFNHEMHINRQHGIPWWPFRRRRRRGGHHFGGERPLRVVRCHSFLSKEFDDINSRAHSTRQDQGDSTASQSENTIRREIPKRKATDASSYTLEELQSYVGSKRKDVAKILGVSVSTFKRICRHHGITRWPNPIKSTVRGSLKKKVQLSCLQTLGRPLDRHEDESPSPTCKTQSTNGQSETVLPDSIAGLSNCNAENGSTVEIEKTPNSCHGNYPDMGFHMSSNYKESEVGGSSERAFQPKDQSTMSIAYQNPNNLVFPQSQIVSTEMLISENIGTPVDWRSVLASLEEELFREENVSESRNLTVPTCSDPTPNEPVATIPDTMPKIAHMMPHLRARQDVMSLTLKVTYKGKIIRFPFPLTSGIMELKEKVSEKLRPTFQLGSFDVEYKDEEGDWILINCNEDLRNHLQLLSSTGNQVIRLQVVDSCV